jgi:hypothetical protein
MLTPRLAKLFLLALISLLLTITACQGLPLGGGGAPTLVSAELMPTIIFQTVEAARKLQPTATATPTPLPSPTHTRQPTATPSATAPALPLAGPWALVRAEDGLYALNAYGYGLTRLSGESITYPLDLRAWAAPAGGRFAFISAENETGAGLALNVGALPHLDVRRVTPLFSPGASYEAARAITEMPSLAWSPDGRRLAFIAALQGGSADPYVYSLADGSIQRLHDHPSQAYAPVWSPDGRYLFFTGAESFGSGAGFEMAGMWVADTQENRVTELRLPAQSNGEEFVAWASPERLLLNSWHPSCGKLKLRSVDAASGNFRPLWMAFFNEAYYDANSKNALLTVDRFVSQCDVETYPGIYLAAANEDPVLLIEEKDPRLSYSTAAGMFFALTGETLNIITPQGSLFPLASDLGVFPLPSSPQGWWAWPSEQGLYVSKGSGGKLSEVMPGPVSGVSWSPDGQALFFSGELGLYFAQAPAFVPQLIDSIYPRQADGNQPAVVWIKQ